MDLYAHAKSFNLGFNQLLGAYDLLNLMESNEEERKDTDWTRSATLSAATKELVEANLILKTREGRFLNPGGRCALYAVTWHPIDDCFGKDLEVRATIKAPRLFSKNRFNKADNLS